MGSRQKTDEKFIQYLPVKGGLVFGEMWGFIPIIVPFHFLLHSNCCYRMADSPSPPEVVVEVVGWDGIDPLPELPQFHSTAEDSFGGSLYIFGKPAIFWLKGWRAFHRGDDETPTQKAPVLARFRSFLVRYYGEDWEAMILSESGEVLLFELRAILAGWLGLVEEQREVFAQAMENRPQIVFRARVKSLAEAGGFLFLD